MYKKKCEKCGKEHDGTYGSGRFCSEKCARSFSTSKNRKEISDKVSKTLKNKYEYIEYNGEKITADKYSKLLNRKDTQKEKRAAVLKKRQNLYDQYSLKKSPYKEFDTLYVQYDDNFDKYLYLTKHDNNNKIIKRYKIYEYRYLIELELGRKLLSNEIVHHINHNHSDNSRKNLIVLTRRIHNQLHKNKLSMEDVLANKLYVYR